MEKLRKYDLSKKDNDWKLVDRKTKKVVKKLGPTKKEATKKAAKILKEKDGVSLVIHNTNKS